MSGKPELRAALDPLVETLAHLGILILRKLQWYDAGGRVSDRQWADVLGVLRSRREALDREYLDRWSAALGVDGLLRGALDDTGD